MDNKPVLYKIINFIAIIIVVSAVNFLFAKYYLLKIFDQKIKTEIVATKQVVADSSKELNEIGIKMAEEINSRNKILNFNEISGTIIDIGTDFIKIKPSGELLSNITDQAFVFDYAKDRIVKINADTKILKDEIIDNNTSVNRKKIADLTTGVYILITSKEAIGNNTEFIADTIKIAL